MNAFYRKSSIQFLKSIISGCVSIVFLATTILSPVYAQNFQIPAVGTMIMPSQPYIPAHMLGMTLNMENPLEIDFIIDRGDDNLDGELLKEESQKLLSYFYAAMTVPEDEMWVNLSPYEENRIMAEGLGDTVLGRDMLAQDYILKQLSASIAYPENELGQQFWSRVRQKAQDDFGRTDIPMNTFNKIWIVPETAKVFVHEQTVVVTENYLKVMLEEDYLALAHNSGSKSTGDPLTGLTNEIVREVLIPEIEYEVNYGRHFAPLRQMFHALVLATWYKQNLKTSILTQSIADQNKTEGNQIDDPQAVNQIYNQYVEAFQVGVYDYVKEEMDAVSREIIPRKYFSGGVAGKVRLDSAQLPDHFGAKVETRPYAVINGAALLEVEADDAMKTDSIVSPAESDPELAELISEHGVQGTRVFDNLKDRNILVRITYQPLTDGPQRIMDGYVSSVSETSIDIQGHQVPISLADITGISLVNVGALSNMLRSSLETQIPLTVTYFDSESEGNRTRSGLVVTNLIPPDDEYGPVVTAWFNNEGVGVPLANILSINEFDFLREKKSLVRFQIKDPITEKEHTRTGNIAYVLESSLSLEGQQLPIPIADITSFEEVDLTDIFTQLSVLKEQGRRVVITHLDETGYRMNTITGNIGLIVFPSSEYNIQPAVWMGDQSPSAPGILMQHIIDIEELPAEGEGDSAMDTFGGIDFNANNIGLASEGGAMNFQFPVPDINPENVRGVRPVILNITPLPQLLPLLGLAPRDPEEDFAV